MEMHCVGWQSTVLPISLCYHTEHWAVYFLCASTWVCGHSVATSLPVVWTYSLSVLSYCLFTCCSADQTPSPPWCDSPATLMNGSAQRPSAAVKCPLGLHQSQKEQSGLHGHESQLSHSIMAVQRQLKRLREKTSGRRRSSTRIRHDGKEQPGVLAWWASQAPMAFRAEPLWSESTSLQSSPLKHSSRKFLSISHHCIESLRESWLTEDIVLERAVSLSLPLPSAHQVLSVTFPDVLCNAETEQLWQENIQNISVILQDNQKREKRWKSERTDLGRGRFFHYIVTQNEQTF